MKVPMPGSPLNLTSRKFILLRRYTLRTRSLGRFEWLFRSPLHTLLDCCPVTRARATQKPTQLLAVMKKNKKNTQPRPPPSCDLATAAPSTNTSVMTNKYFCARHNHSLPGEHKPGARAGRCRRGAVGSDPQRGCGVCSRFLRLADLQQPCGFMFVVVATI